MAICEVSNPYAIMLVLTLVIKLLALHIIFSCFNLPFEAPYKNISSSFCPELSPNLQDILQVIIFRQVLVFYKTISFFILLLCKSKIVYTIKRALSKSNNKTL